MTQAAKHASEQARPGQARPGRAGPGQAGPGQAGGFIATMKRPRPATLTSAAHPSMSSLYIRDNRLN